MHLWHLLLDHVHLVTNHDVLAEDRHQAGSKAVNWLLLQAHETYSAPRITHHVVQTRAHHSPCALLLLYGVVPENSNVLGVNLEEGVVDEVPGSWLTPSAQLFAFWMPGLRLKVEAVD